MTEPREERGLAIIGPYDNIWTDRLFKTPEEAKRHIETFWAGTSRPIDWSKWKVVPATQIITVDSVAQEVDPIRLGETDGQSSSMR